VADLLNAVSDWAVALAGTPWVFLALYVFATIDGFFPPIPSESVIIALAALFMASGSADFWILGAVAAAGAFTGDQIAYSIGRHIPLGRLRFMQGPRAKRSLAWAERALAERGSSFIISARYVPIGRVAVNMTAGATGFPRHRFTGLAVVAAISWSIYSVLLGIGAGRLFGKQHPLLAMAAGVAAGLLLGLLVDWLISRWGRRRGRPVGAVTTGEGAAVDADRVPGAPADDEPEPAAARTGDAV